MNAAQAKPARRTFGEFLKDVVLFLAAPFISLVYIAMFPFIGLVMLVRAKQEERMKRNSTP